MREAIIEDFPDYKVREDGTVWSRNKPGRKSQPSNAVVWKEIAVRPSPSSGYRFATLLNGSKKRTEKVAVLVLEAFVGKRPPGMHCCHYDDVHHNDRLDNLRWDTVQGNADDRVRNGHQQRGQTAAVGILFDRDVEAIIKAYARGEFQRQIAEEHKVHQVTISKIITGENWSHFMPEIVRPIKRGVPLAQQRKPTPETDNANN